MSDPIRDWWDHHNADGSHRPGNTDHHDNPVSSSANFRFNELRFHAQGQFAKYPPSFRATAESNTHRATISWILNEFLPHFSLTQKMPLVIGNPQGQPIRKKSQNSFKKPFKLRGPPRNPRRRTRFTFASSSRFNRQKPRGRSFKKAWIPYYLYIQGKR